MFPCLAAHDSRYGGGCYAESACQFGVRRSGTQFTDQPDGCFIELGRWVPPLAHHVTTVFLLCAEEQMIGPDTGAVVTAVKDAHAVGDRAMSQFPRDPGSLVRTLIDCELPVTSGCETGNPNPAFAGLIDFGPETFFDGGILEGHSLLRSSGVMPSAARTARGFSSSRDAAFCTEYHTRWWF